MSIDLIDKPTEVTPPHFDPFGWFWMPRGHQNGHHLLRAVCASSLFVVSFAGCSFPRMEARAKAKALDESGFHREAQDLEERANDLNEVDINLDGKGFYRPESTYDPRNDPQHFLNLKK